ncbi:hypothetical protein GOBAR_AA37774 [Gossypium barbadense]|uniref:Uncharacterized protein n=1 Tax=Gossypium barbadense TaxID=3634 RepID=A0A2P5VVU2_GOSBA|nr:hypothetical protein GOBAR_AA37774 [Gossypium barbadense]
MVLQRLSMISQDNTAIHVFRFPMMVGTETKKFSGRGRADSTNTDRPEQRQKLRGQAALGVSQGWDTEGTALYNAGPSDYLHAHRYEEFNADYGTQTTPMTAHCCQNG